MSPRLRGRWFGDEFFDRVTRLRDSREEPEGARGQGKGRREAEQLRPQAE
jgi:hypothetical protein